MKILIISDTHRKNENYLKVLQLIGKPDMVIHLGDVEGSEYTICEACFYSKKINYDGKYG